MAEALRTAGAQAAAEKYFLSLKLYRFVEIHCSNRSRWHTWNVLTFFASKIQASVSPITEYSVTTVILRQSWGGIGRLVEIK